MRRRHTLGQTWFADLCFYKDVRAALVLNAGAVIDAHVFGDAFDGMLDVLEGWDTVREALHGCSSLRS